MQNRTGRFSAVLMSISSLPNRFGVGGLGREAENFIKFIKQAGFSAWQILPVNPLDSGNSPYGSCSAFAGNFLYIDPQWLYENGFLTKIQLDDCVYSGSPYTVDYPKVFELKRRMLKNAYNAKADELGQCLELFKAENPWVKDYALYMAIKDTYDSAPFYAWESQHKCYKNALLKSDEFYKSSNYYVFEQYIFYLQYNEIYNFAKKNNILIIGDIPIYVAADSVDVWKNPELFSLNDDFKPKMVAGVPPDAFSKTGQLWGNPVYEWKSHEKNDFLWWRLRLRHTFEMYDIVRIDHFRGFSSYYQIEFGSADAVNGKWVSGPGMKLFSKILEDFPAEKFIAEDLGTITPDVEKLLLETKIKSMRVVQFGFSGEDSPHLPHNYKDNCIAYVGTHDNNTLLGWLWELDSGTRKTVLDYCGFKGSDWGCGGFKSEPCRCVTETVFKSAAKAVIVPFQDLCGFGSDARMNMPGTAENNWRFRTVNDVIDSVDREYFLKINKLFFRV